MIKKSNPPDYKGQPREGNGRFSRGKQNGSKANNRSMGATANRPQQVAGVWSVAPYDKPQLNHRPGEKA